MYTPSTVGPTDCLDAVAGRRLPVNYLLAAGDQLASIGSAQHRDNFDSEVCVPELEIIFRSITFNAMTSSQSQKHKR